MLTTGKHDAMTPAEMDDMNMDYREGNHLYTSDSRSDRAGIISQIVNTIGDDVMKPRGKINLNDLQAVKRIAQEYILSCQRSVLLPSKSGLCRALGYSRKGLYLYMQNNLGGPTEEFLSILFDAFSEAYDVAAMGGAIQQVYAIFTQKAQYGLSDQQREPEVKQSPLGPDLSEEELRAKLADIVIDRIEEV